MRLQECNLIIWNKEPLKRLDFQGKEYYSLVEEQHKTWTNK